LINSFIQQTSKTELEPQPVKSNGKQAESYVAKTPKTRIFHPLVSMPRRLASEAAKLWKAVYHPSDRATIHVMNGCSRNKCASPLTGTDENGPYYDHYAWEIETQDLVVVPSMSFSFKELTTIDGFIHYEERSLYVLFALSTPGTRIIIVTSTPLDEWILEYHFSLLPLHHREAYKNRVHFYSVGDPSPNKCLTEKILAHPRLLDRLKRDEVGSKNHNRVLMVYRSTLHEDKLARALDMPYYAARPEQSVYGTKQGSRTIFRDLHIPCADGTYDEEKDLTSLMKSIWSVLRRNPGATKGLVKLADGFSGMGNATLDLGGIQQRLLQINSSIEDADEKLRALTLHALKTAAFHNRTWEEFSEELEVMRAIFELFIEYTSGERVGNESTITSPSVQVVVNEDGSVSVLSTHEQILDNQVYHGCEFPCRSDYRLQLMEYGRLIGEYLSRHDVRDRFGVDFLCVPRPNGRWDIYAVEINLRLTGTTHPW
jgi:hypothetical protein